MQGLVVFKSISAAIQAGYSLYDRTEYGYIARIKTDHGWAMALVKLY